MEQMPVRRPLSKVLHFREAAVSRNIFIKNSDFEIKGFSKNVKALRSWGKHKKVKNQMNDQSNKMKNILENTSLTK